ncbi:MAG: major facilitator super transporter protein [Alyxoria varia]|nr:MAG: major facilitator super transporter protein [Alyxoria varia]
MKKSMLTLALASANLLIPLALLVFASGFFPYKPFLTGLAKYHDIPGQPPPPAPFDKVIFMVIDALRSDFVFSDTSGFKFTQSLISDGVAIPFTANAQAPTVTMPRVKALTTGSIPSFLDMILNFAQSDDSSTLANQDTWLGQMKATKSSNLVMYGDDTWLKLFPNTFHRADGTSSFFVSDFTEVDNNVTRHIPSELSRNDWDGMILHYLGMDHIGHKAGPRSVNMVPKQKEMDNILQKIYSAVESEAHLQSTLLILCGDHGMNEGGNHGGSAPGETSPAMVFISPKLQSISERVSCPTKPNADFDYYETIEQSDVAPTLAGLLGIPMSLNNLGVFIPQFLSLWPNGMLPSRLMHATSQLTNEEDDRTQLVFRNALQLLDIVKATFPHPLYEDEGVVMNCNGPASTRETLACAWKEVLQARDSSQTESWSSSRTQESLFLFCRKAQDGLSTIASNYIVSRLYWGIAIGGLAVIFTLAIMMTSIVESNVSSTVGSALLSTVYAIMMFASSYVEEEQQFWYWVSSAWAMINCLSCAKSFMPETGLILVLLRFVRRWNQSGQKHSGAPDIATTFFRAEPSVLLILILLTFVDLLPQLIRRSLNPISFSKSLAALGSATLCAVCIVFKAIFTVNDSPELWATHAGTVRALGERLPALITLARIVFSGTALLIITLIVRRTRGPSVTWDRSGDSTSIPFISAIHAPLAILLITQSRATNMPLFLLFSIQLRCLRQIDLSATAIALIVLIMSHASFFASGGTNSISSIDLSNAYNGVSSYNIVAVGILLFLGNWAGPIYWSTAGLCLLLEQHSSDLSAERSGNLDRSKRREPQNKARAISSQSAYIATRGAIRESFQTYLAILTLFTCIATTGVMASCAALRTHLFVWTVFSPKFLYMAAWVIGWHFVVNLGIGTLMVWMG